MKKISLYIHIPFCQKKCLYCDFISYCNSNFFINSYIDAVIAELKLRAEKLQDYKISTIFVGGGTPSVLKCGQLSKIIDSLAKLYHLDIKEFSVEVNPITFDYPHAKEYADIGVNRISVGVQTLSDELLRLIGRAHTAKDAETALDLASSYFDNVSADMMIGLPEQDVVSIVNTLHGILKRKIQHISCYALTLEESTPLFEMCKNKVITLKDEDFVANSYTIVKDILFANGLVRYETSNFAKQGYECKHNLVYWQRGEYLGVGVAAHSLVFDRRKENVSDLEQYISTLSEGSLAVAKDTLLTKKEKKEEAIMLSLRLDRGLDIDAFDKEFGTDFLSEYSIKLDKVKEYVLLEHNHLRVKSKYFYVSNSIISELI